MKRLFYKLVPAEVRRELKRLIFRRPQVCSSLYSWSKANPVHAEIVQEFWEPHRKPRVVPKNLDGSVLIPKKFSDHLECQLYHKTLFRIKNVTMRGREGVLFLPDGTVTHQTGWALQHITETPAYKDKWNGPEIFKKGNYSTLILYWGLGYYHWFKDVLAMLHRSLELMPKNTIFIMPKEFHKVYGGEFYLKSLQALGIDRDRVVEFDGTESWIFENFWWQPPPVHPGDQTPGAPQWIGRRISESVPVKSDEKKLWVYISRAMPYARILANEEEILPALMEMGFQVFRLEEMPFDEQVRVFRNAEIVVGPHGAGFTNLIFSKPGTHVVEILAKGYERRCYWTLSDELGHDYRFYLGEPKFPERKGEPDIEIDASNFLRIIKNNFIESGLIRNPKA